MASKELKTISLSLQQAIKDIHTQIASLEAPAERLQRALGCLK